MTAIKYFDVRSKNSNTNKIQILLMSFAVILFCSNSIVAQEHIPPPEGKAEYRHRCNNLHKNEIGIANAPVYFLNEKEFTYGFHFHYIRNIENSPFGIGLGYERIFDEHKHQTVGIVGSYRMRYFVFNIAPGITFEQEKGVDTEILFAAHFEVSYEWEIGNLHLGPVAEIAYDREDIHLALGLHVGYGF